MINELNDVVVVGAGAAGLNAALLLGRAHREVVVLDAGEPRNAPAAHMHGFLSRDGLSRGRCLNSAGRRSPGTASGSSGDGSTSAAAGCAASR
ncbi:FAD-dependent oxidoreductase [Spirillospora sp. CA-294931]|uniref:FAD-dependent oxidoreductase n=1 Tax=Spirillospora sp. CA-294931 TaxID=3240042 RepID=UPI003D8F68B6